MNNEAVRVERLMKSYGNRSKRVIAIEDVSFSVAQGEVVGLLGPNGAGKTTLIKCILGLVKPDAGHIRVLGVDSIHETARTYQHMSALLEGARNVYWRLSPRENLAFFAGLQGIDARRRSSFHDELIERFGLKDKANTPVNDLSQGMKQKVAVACAFARETKVLFLDEPTLGLDLHASQTLRKSIKDFSRANNLTILISTHDMDVVSDLCQRVIILRKGRIIADDLVDNLKKPFRTQTYRFQVAAPLPNELQLRLRERFGISDWKCSDVETSFAVHADAGSGDLYAVLDELRVANAPLTGVTLVEPDLAEIFLHMTKVPSPVTNMTHDGTNSLEEVAQ